MRTEKHPLVIGLVGASGSGKDTVAEYLRDAYGANLLRLSDPIKDILAMFFPHPSREDQAWVAVEFKKRFGKDIFCRALDRRIDPDQTVLSINGLRYPEDYDYLRKFPNNILIFITADRRIRWERIFGRGEKSDDALSFEDFIEKEESLETEKYISEIGKKADFTVSNEGNFQGLQDGIDAVLRSLGKEKRSSSIQ